ncbi:MAG: hypothetical protein Q9165_007083 [Trypethelium subeluteriae]
MAIGEKLQAAVESNRKTFVDDICGVSLSVRFTSVLFQVWNRDGNHKAAIDRLLETVIQELPEELRPKDGTYYYKKHDEHAGYQKPEGVPAKPTIIEETKTAQNADDGANAHE